MQIYLVGGAVRDKLLGLEVKDRDFVVIGMTTEDMLAKGFIQVGRDFPVFLHPKTKDEYALARLERKVAKGYRGFVAATKDVSLADDLKRRDLTINALAEDDNGNIIDLFNGQEDLAQGLLRHISPAFSEDPVRILRIARFAARFKSFGFKVAHNTHKLMCNMVECGEVDSLVSERVWSEVQKVLSYKTPSAFFKVLASCGALNIVLPNLTSNSHLLHSNNFLYMDNLATDNITIKWALLCSSMPEVAVRQLCKKISCPKKFTDLSRLASRYYIFIKDSNYSADKLLNFYLASDSLRRVDRFLVLMQVFKLLKLDISLITDIHKQLLAININDIQQDNIAIELKNRRYQIISDNLK